VDYFASADAEVPGFACGVNDLCLGDGAQVTYVCAQGWGEPRAWHADQFHVVARDAHAKALTLNAGMPLFPQ
jgi:Fe-S cluster assembly protein SufD